ncbi:MAG: AAA family ATPase [Burkholderiales bacterium]
MNHFPRPTLAAAIADELSGKTVLSDAQNGLFLAGPRRTGKTEFLRQDLKPELERRGMLVIYVDLWEDKTRSPLASIAASLAQAVENNLSGVAGFVKGAGIDKISLPGGFNFDLSKIGKTDGLTLYQILNVLHQASKKPVVLIVDEAQHALTNDDGDAAMSALKSARDQMRSDGKSKLLLVMSGSHRDKLMRLLNSAATPFWGSQVRPLPLLEADFVAHLTRTVRQEKPELASVRQSVMEEAFTHMGHQPQFLLDAIRSVLPASNDGAAFESALLALAKERRATEREELTNTYLRLPPLQQAVLQRLLEQGENYRAFDAKSLAFYGAHSVTKVSVAQVQRALDALRDNDPPLVWKSLRGDYSVYDQALSGWYAYLVASNNWPPRH